MTTLTDCLTALTSEETALLARLLHHSTWTPASLPQIDALLSPADVLGYGGAAGGGKTDLLLGAALTGHHSAIILRREAVQVKGLEERSRDMLAGAKGARYNGSARSWRLASGARLEFGSMRDPGDWTKYQGRPYDFIGFDEAAHFLQSQVRSLMGWNRTSRPGQRCRVVMAFNPPTNADGLWVIEFFAPWLDRRHPRPARPGELRWFVAGPDGKDREAPGPEPVEVDGRQVTPRSRTFVPARVEDNPYLMATGYLDTLDALPEPLRSMMRHGDFHVGQEDDVWQVVPTAWVELAMSRWRARETTGLVQDSLGVDVARGGRDETIVVPRYGNWFGEFVAKPGRETPDGPSVAGLVMMVRRDAAPVHVDIIGPGSSVHDFLASNHVHVVPVNGAEGSSELDRGGQLRFANKRAELWWRMREALDPVRGRPIALPQDRMLLGDLCAPRWKMTHRGVLVEGKDDIIKRLGRSPDRGDAACYALLATPKRRSARGALQAVMDDPRI